LVGNSLTHSRAHSSASSHAGACKAVRDVQGMHVACWLRRAALYGEI